MRTLLIIGLILLAAPYLAARPESEERIDELEDRVKDLEELLDEKADQHKSLSAFIAEKINFGGVYGMAYQGLIGKEESNFSVTENNLEIFLRPQLTPKLDLFFASGFLATAGPPGGINYTESIDPASNTIVREFNGITFKNPLIIGYGRWVFRNEAQVLFGKKMVDFGIIIDEHFPQTLYSFHQPQYVRPFPGNTVVANFVIGSWFQGRASRGPLSHEYTFYYGTYDAVANEPVLGADYRLGLARDQVVVGGSWQHGTRNTALFEKYDSYVGYLIINTPYFLMKNEVVKSEQDGPLDKTAWYVQPVFKVHPKFEPFSRVDYFDDGTDAGTKTELIIGANFFPASMFRLRTELILHDFKQELDSGGRDRNFTGLTITTVVPF